MFFHSYPGQWTLFSHELGFSIYPSPTSACSPTPHLHRHIVVGRATRTFKYHHGAGSCTCDLHSTAPYWDKISPQAIISLNLLHSSRRNPYLSAYITICGNFNFNAIPLAVATIRSVCRPAEPNHAWMNTSHNTFVYQTHRSDLQTYMSVHQISILYAQTYTYYVHIIYLRINISNPWNPG